ncbi:BZ3500_MvSof-1268-A1-R1_Chr4-1g06685 [Microbotryum saponariae]|uniref:BZ3500_MvSof-1268-A1-R1_Chr4-1g06685 protein n=1 Tax=Microbotryum saponariae TaxID=289078 RepID=A0A2X0KSB0_9BASI|nr:BZ3500_MvSof-1268-A1-R1_Chr4-1g06685 [Microbotryum saponariae]SDA06350.1 BZ3501_MvSof-1269-A2-R1_Chr4-1g06395 [Microbotryum saponariae]
MSDRGKCLKPTNVPAWTTVAAIPTRPGNTAARKYLSPWEVPAKNVPQSSKELERLEVAFDYHQGRGWKHYTRFFTQADSQLDFDFMVLYDNTYRTELGDPDTSGHFAPRRSSR